tara:strand:- start:334 stop:615 length:282 start_codon:yes stop_codon:yes gene_type:complete
MDHNAVMKAYPNIVYLQSDFVDYGLDDDGNKVSIEQSKVDAARVELDKEKYKWQREEEYPDWGTQLDYIYHHGIEKWKTDIVDPVKAKYPKPS